MNNKGFLPLLVLFLGFSSVLFSDAVPTTRSLKSFRADPAVQNLFDQLPEGDVIIQGRMAIETTDYSGTGANNSHDPITPSRV